MAVLLGCLFGGVAFGAVINVPTTSYPTIQAGINAASSGDTVLVANGTYTGAGNKNLDFGGKAITVKSENGADNCIIDCEGDGRGFYFHSGEGQESVVSGFKIINTKGLVGTIGSGIICESSSPKITNCIISNGQAENGGGINCLNSSSPYISNCTIENNSNSSGYGAGICCLNSSPNITNCTIKGNRVESEGGGIYVGSSSNPTFSYCNVIENSTVQGNGGGIYCNGSSPQIKNCIISDNSARSGYGIGGGIYLNFCTSATIENCTISGNDGGGVGMADSSANISKSMIRSNSGYWSGGIFSTFSSANIINCVISSNTCFSGWGGGIESGYSTLSITNSTISGNSAIYGGGISCRGNPSPIILNSILWGDLPEEVYILENSKPSIMYSTIQGGWPGETNKSWSPAFVDPANSNFHLQNYSSCIGIGTPVGAPNTDIENNKRPNPSGSNPDVGAYENSRSFPTVPPISFLNIFGFELGNKWIYKGTENGNPYTVEREITSIDQTSFPVNTYEMKIKENGTITGTEWYEYTGNQINLWGVTYEGDTLTISKGLKTVWLPMMVGDHVYSSAIAYALGYPFNISLTADVINKEMIALGFDAIETYQVRYQVHVWGQGIDITDTFEWWMAPYLGVVKEQSVDAIVKLTSFAIGGGVITQNSDSDDDNLSDYSEIFTYNTHWQYDDTDGDDMPDGWEVQYGLNPLIDDAKGDLDGDGFTNIFEYNRNTDPTDPNSHPSRAMPWIPLLLLDD